MWFSFDQENDGMTFHDTEEKALEAAQEALNTAIDREEPDDILEAICWGKVSETVIVNRKTDTADLFPVD